MKCICSMIADCHHLMLEMDREELLQIVIKTLIPSTGNFKTVLATSVTRRANYAYSFFKITSLSKCTAAQLTNSENLDSSAIPIHMFTIHIILSYLLSNVLYCQYAHKIHSLYCSSPSIFFLQ